MILIVDVLIRDVPDDVLAVIDRRAQRLGLSRTEYLQRLLGQQAGRSDNPVTAADLRQLSRSVRDLADPEVADQAWS
ncbi:antitoxin [Kribbella qitaiheensis]|uniref:type II toxin-antitoxin system VapB family antitoxin n=1 Tax=Kribbella qitaiheensis TaxID=1544730 RepID=UPI003614CB81